VIERNSGSVGAPKFPARAVAGREAACAFIALSVMPASRQALTAFDAANFMRERRFMASIPDRVAMIAIFALRDDALRLPRG